MSYPQELIRPNVIPPGILSAPFARELEEENPVRPLHENPARFILPLASEFDRAASETAGIGPVVKPQQEPQSEIYQREFDTLANTPAQDKNGRLKSGFYNFLAEMGRNANAVLASGRPVDMYGMASIIGGGLGGFAGGVYNPAVDEDYRRQTRMGQLRMLIGSALQQEKVRRDAAVQEEELEIKRDDLTRRREADRQLAIMRTKPKAYSLAGRQIDFRLANDGAGGMVWEAYEPTVDGAPVRDASKAVGDDGLTAWQRAQLQTRRDLSAEQIEARKAIARENNKFRGSENEKDRDLRRKQFAERQKLDIKKYELSERRLGEQIEKWGRDEEARQQTLGVKKAQVRITHARAQKMARENGIDLPDLIDLFSEYGVEVK